MLGKMQVAQHLRVQQAHRVAGRGVAKSGVEFLGDRGAADEVAALEDQDLPAGPGEVAGAGEAIVAGAYDDDVVTPPCAACCSGYNHSICINDQLIAMSDLTPRQTQILRLIQRFISQTGMPPTRAEIARELGFRSANAAEEHLRALARKGVIALVPSTSRGIQLKDTIREQMGLPLIGRVAAGKPILAEENVEARFQIDPALFQPRPHYLLKVTGMSMKDAGILDGDLVAVHRTTEVRSRQIIVARLESEVTVKRYRQEGSLVWLLPENSEFEPIRVNLKEQDFIIEGVVVGVVRRGKATGLM